MTEPELMGVAMRVPKRFQIPPDNEPLQCPKCPHPFLSGLRGDGDWVVCPWCTEIMRIAVDVDGTRRLVEPPESDALKAKYKEDILEAAGRAFWEAKLHGDWRPASRRLTARAPRSTRSRARGTRR